MFAKLGKQTDFIDSHRLLAVHSPSVKVFDLITGSCYLKNGEIIRNAERNSEWFSSKHFFSLYLKNTEIRSVGSLKRVNGCLF